MEKERSIKTFFSKLKAQNCNYEDLDEIEDKVQDGIAQAIEDAENGTWEPVENLTKNVYHCGGYSMTTQKMTYREALRIAHRSAMQRDSRVFLMGEDVGAYGGCLCCQQRFAARVRTASDSKYAISENAFVGTGIGAALGGMRPLWK